MTIRTAVLGYGLAGSAFHAPVIAAVPALELTAIATSQRDRVAADWPGVRVADTAALLDDPAIDLIVVATPNDSHVPLAREALRRGKHVVIDKPFALAPEEGEMLIAEARAAGRMLTAFHNRRWDSDFLTVRALLDSGRLGEVLLYQAHWDRFRPGLREGWREDAAGGAGMLNDLGTHLLDQALLLFGMPEAIEADVQTQRAVGEVNDWFALTLFYGRRRVQLATSSLIVAPRPRFSIHGSAGSFVKFGLDPQEPQLRAGMRPGAEGYGIEDSAIAGTFTPADGVPEAVPSHPGDYRHFYAGVAAAIADGAPPPVDPADAVAGLRLIALAWQSAREGRRIAIG